jgi:spore maturation protein SpmB
VRAAEAGETVMDRKDVWRITGNGIHKGLASFWMLVKVVVPVYVVMTVLGQTPILPWIAGVCAPFMKFWGLPGDAATALVIGMTINIYACIGATAALGLTPAQITIIGVIIGISHNNIMETAILRKTGAPVRLLVPIRFIAGLGLGWLVAVGYRLIG